MYQWLNEQDVDKNLRLKIKCVESGSVTTEVRRIKGVIGCVCTVGTGRWRRLCVYAICMRAI